MTFIRKLPSRSQRHHAFRTASGILDHPLSRVMTTENAGRLPSAAASLPLLPQRRPDRLAPLRVVEPGIVVSQRLRRLDMQGREHRPLLLEHMAGLLLEVGELG